MRPPRALSALAIVLLTACVSQTATAQEAFQRAAVSGGEIEYRVVGQGEPVLLIHGSVMADAFEAMLPEPALADYRLITYHRRGYSGSSRVQAPFTIAQQAQDALALLDHLGAKKAHLVGHSYGGAIALQLAASHPERVASIVLLEPAVSEPGPAAQALFAEVGKAVELHAKGDDRAALALFANAVVGPGAWESMAQQGAGAMQEQAVKDAGTFFDVELPAIQEWKFTFDDVARLRVPVFNVVGSASPAMFRETHESLRRVLSQAEAWVVEGSSHDVQMSRPRVVAEGIADFLKKHRI